MQQSLLLQRRHSTRPRGALLLVNCVCVALVCHSQLCPAAATGLRSRASEGAHQATNPLVLLRNKAVQLQTQANVLSDIGSYDHAQAVLRHGDNILSDSPFNMALFCRSPERCPAETVGLGYGLGASESDFGPSVLQGERAGLDLCFCWVANDAQCYVGSCDSSPRASGQLFSAVAERGACKFHRRAENLVDVDNCGGTPSDVEAATDTSLFRKMSADPSKKAKLLSGTPLPLPDFPPKPKLGSTDTKPNLAYPTSVQDAVDLMSERAQQLRSWDMQNAVIAAHKIKTDLEMAAKQQA